MTGREERRPKDEESVRMSLEEVKSGESDRKECCHS